MEFLHMKQKKKLDTTVVGMYNDRHNRKRAGT